jgi:hypothetical protein
MLKIILTSQENFDVKYRRNKQKPKQTANEIFIFDANETVSYCRYGYSRHQNTELLDYVVYKSQKVIQMNEKKKPF